MSLYKTYTWYFDTSEKIFNSVWLRVEGRGNMDHKLVLALNSYHSNLHLNMLLDLCSCCCCYVATFLVAQKLSLGASDRPLHPPGGNKERWHQ